MPLRENEEDKKHKGRARRQLLPANLPRTDSRQEPQICAGRSTAPTMIGALTNPSVPTIVGYLTVPRHAPARGRCPIQQAQSFQPMVYLIGS